MARKLYSPTRTISNRGEHPRFIGQFPCAKAEASHLVFDSLSALYCGIYLEWLPNVVSMAFEPHEFTFEAEAGLPELRCHPDYEAILDTGEIEFYEAKYSRDGLRDVEREKLALTAAHFERRGIPYKVIYREDLEADGLIDTIILLRHYGLMQYPEGAVEAAAQRLAQGQEAPLEGWRTRAAAAGVPTGLLYHLLYHQRLPLVYRRLLPVELQPCRV
ncbi:PDDEXK family nuclease [Thiobacillus sedimenti]|uniref:TnsA endonuclease N-terminal domain-containing protein n=1 Tax=Thiobacillus sedimenti TaxID=3110231 RepID=A0ABZ1CQJ8_9PROT|nr:hypothetical protein [Thiobacillus sp. SCUT-2]WRS40602.1 hypothetical protein VA613_06910 [Thiobacillus sp. SCUT-2]